MGLMFRRRRPVARLAVGAATAGIARQGGRPRAEHDHEDEQPAAAHSTARYQPAPYVAPPPTSTGGEVDELKQLAQMHDAGALTDQEFAAAKAQLLGI